MLTEYEIKKFINSKSNGGGNPYHGPDGKFASGPGASGSSSKLEKPRSRNVGNVGIYEMTESVKVGNHDILTTGGEKTNKAAIEADKQFSEMETGWRDEDKKSRAISVAYDKEKKKFIAERGIPYDMSKNDYVFLDSWNSDNGKDWTKIEFEEIEIPEWLEEIHKKLDTGN